MVTLIVIFLKISLICLIRIATDSYETSIGFLIARANVTQISYEQSGRYFCKAESDGLMDEMSIDLTVQCRKYKYRKNISEQLCL